MTTVGFGDITPLTPNGKFIASLIMLMGYGIIAVPTGIVSSEMVSMKYKRRNDKLSQLSRRRGMTMILFTVNTVDLNYKPQ